MKNILYILILNFLYGSVVAQMPGSGISLESNVLDGVYIQEHIPTKRVVSYTHLREADVMWAKRVWRVIDLKEKMNHKLYYPLTPQNDRISLWDVIRYGVLTENRLTVYSLNKLDLDDKFRFPVLPTNGNVNDEEFKKELNSYFGNTTSEQVVLYNEESGEDEPQYTTDANGDEIPSMKDTTIFYKSQDIIQYHLKEDWFFDKQRSVLDVRIIGISPCIIGYDQMSGDIVGIQNLFWLYFPECRYVFQNFYVFNDANDSQKMSFDDLFWKREFSSYINKESNVFDRAISPNWDGLDALLESERIRTEMFTFEHDLWHF
ncbi:gliding motility protein GldN [bacterium]|nr:gliding motility protein GldN [bacterium]